MDSRPRSDHPRSAETIVLGHDQPVEFRSPDPGILDLRGDGIPAAGAQIASAGIAAFGPRAMTRSGEGGCKLAPVSPAVRNGANQRCGQTDPGEVDAEALLDEQEPARLGKTERLARHSRLAVTQSPGDWRQAAWGFGQPEASVGRTETIASVCACRLYTARIPPGYMMTVLPQVGLSPEKSESPSAEGDGDDLIGFRAARGGDLGAFPGSFADQRARQR